MIAKVQGITARYAARTPLDVAAAVAEILGVTADPHLLGHAWPSDTRPPGWPDVTDPWRDQKRAILTAAGADPQPAWWEDGTAILDPTVVD